MLACIIQGIHHTSALLYRFAHAETSGKAASVALLAVVIPVYAQTVEHVALLQRALQHLAQQRGCQATHVVLVDDASPLALDTDYAGSGEVLFSQPSQLCVYCASGQCQPARA